MPASIETKKLKGSRTQSLIAFSAEETGKAEEQALTRLGASVRVPGFRPGKAPLDMLRGKIEEASLLEETVRTLLGNLLQTIIDKENIRPILPPKIEITSRTPLAVSVTFVEKPEVTIKGGDRIKVEKKEATIGKEQIDRMVRYLQEQEKTSKEVDRKAKEGDQVTIDFVGTDAAGTEISGTKARGYQIIIGSKELIPGFEDALVGMGKGDQKSFPLTFPADYHAEHLRKKPVTFAVTVSKVEEVTIPEMTDAFVAEHQLGKDVADLRGRIEASLKTQEESVERDRRERELFEAVRKATVVELAPELLEQTEQSLLQEQAQELERRGTNLTDWLKRTKKTEEDFRKDLAEQAAKRLTVRFGVEKLIEDRKIAVTDDEMRGIIDEQITLSPEAERAKLREEFSPGSDAYEQLRWRRTVEKLTEQLLAA